MTTFLEMKSELRKAMGGRDDAVATAAQERGINAGVAVAAAMHEPPELRTTGTLDVPTSGSVSLSSLTRPWRIEGIKNSSGGRMFPLAFHLLDHLWIESSPTMQVYSLYGNTLHCRPKPSSVDTVTVYYLQYPARMDSDSDTYPFQEYEDFVMGFALHYAWMYLEEGDSSDGWLRVAKNLSIPEGAISTARKLLHGEVNLEYPSGKEAQSG